MTTDHSELTEAGATPTELTYKQLSLVDRIKEAVEKSEKHVSRGLQYALVAGQLLCRMKARAGHGGWLTWFHEANFAFSESTAQRYMRLAS